MKSSFPKILALPSLQFLVLVLVLGAEAELSPKNSSAQDGGGAVRSGGPNSPTKCYQTTCRVLPGWSEEKPEDCLKAPAEGTKTVDCPEGYGCYQHFEFNNRGGKLVGVVVIRNCSDYGRQTCLEKEPGNCLKVRLDGSQPTKDRMKDSAKLKDYERNCVKNPPKRGGSGRSGGEDEGRLEVRKEYCVCKGDLCNVLVPIPTLSTKSTGGKQLGSNVTLLGALLMVVFPLRRMYLMG